MQTVLHVGCGRDPLPEWLGDCTEIRLDIDPGVQPDILASMTDLGAIGPFDAVVSQHSLEHLGPTKVGVALSEFKRVLRPGGMLMIAVPDLEGVSPTFDVLFVSPAGPITGHDLFYGKASMTGENPFMAHRCGFVKETLTELLRDVGFANVEVRQAHPYNLIATGYA